MKEPSTDDLALFSDFLRGACHVAVQPPTRGGLDLAFMLSIEGQTRPHRPIRDLADMLPGRKLPFEASEQLDPQGSVADRCATLHRWMQRFPVHRWMRGEPAISGAFRSFETVRKNRNADPRLRDELAEFRFWSLATLAVRFRKLPPLLPPPDKEQRVRAAAAARTLLGLAKVTSLLSATDQQPLVRALEALQRLDDVQRRRRVDRSTEDRRYIGLLALSGRHLFGKCPPSVVRELAPLRLEGPDAVAIERWVSAVNKRSRASLV